MKRFANFACGGSGKRDSLSSATGAALAVAAVVVSGCAGPTYGTGTPAEQQLVEDLTGILSLGPSDREKIDYEPRPGIVKPPSLEVLPPPQESVAGSDNPAWPESPEERLARVRAEATANQDNLRYRPNAIRDESSSQVPQRHLPDRQTRTEQRNEFLKRLQASRQVGSTQRRYLSDPPVEYRQPVETAPVGDLGEEEWRKEREEKTNGGLLGRLFNRN